MKKFPSFLFFATIFLFLSGNTLFGAAESASMVENISRANGNNIGKILYEYSRCTVTPEFISETIRLLGNRNEVLRDVESSGPIQVRDIAFLILENSTGSNFTKYLGTRKVYPTKCIFSYFPKGDDVFRMTVSSFSEDEMTRIIQFGEYWLEGFSKGRKTVTE